MARIKDALGLKWSEFLEKYDPDFEEKMHFASEDGNVYLFIAEGSGDNLEPEDEEDGYVDYWYSEVYTRDNGNSGGGFHMRSTYIRKDNQTIEQILDEIISEDIIEGIEGLPLKEMLITSDEGDLLCKEFEEIERKRIEDRIRELRAS